MKYRKKPTEVDAVQWTGHNWQEVAEFLGGRVELSSLSAVIIDTHDGLETHVDPYEWIVRDERGRMDCCTPYNFSDLYEVKNDA